MLRRLLVAVLATAPLLALVGAGPAHAAAATWGWPLGGTPQVDRPFQPPATAWGAGHRGVDLHGEVGEPVLSAGAGTVTYAGLLAGRGVITVSHAGGLRTTYEPVDATVHVGQHVDTGAVLGSLSTGHASCHPGVACLHWGLLRGRTYLDPLALVVGGHLRLLPIDASPDKHKRKRRRNAEEEEKAGKPTEGRLARFRASIRRAASKVGRVARSGARLAWNGVKAVGRGARAVGRASMRVLRPLGRLTARLGSRAGPLLEDAAPALEEAAPFVLEAVPVVAVGALVVGGAVWYVRSRR